MITKTLLWIVPITLLILSSLFFARDLIVDKVLRTQISRVSKKVAMPINFDSVNLRGFYGVSIKGLSIGIEPWITIDRVEVNLDKASVWSFQPKVDQIYLMSPQINVVGSTLKRALYKQKEKLDWIRKRLQKKSIQSQIIIKNDKFTWQKKLHTLEKLIYKIPTLEVIQGRIKGRDDVLWITKVQLKLQQGKINAQWFGQEPKTGPCKIDGSIKALNIYCTESMRLPINDSVEIAGKQIQWDGGSNPFIKLAGIHLKVSQNYSQLPFTDIGVNLTLGLKPDEYDSYPLNVDLTFPGGGIIKANGKVSQQDATLVTQIQNFPVNALSQNARGKLSADVQIWSDWRLGEFKASGRLTGRDLSFHHPALAESTIGPFNLSTHGLLRAKWNVNQYRNFKITLTDSEVRLGEIHTDLSLMFDALGTKPRMKGSFTIPKMSGQTFADSIPMGLLPHLQPIKLKGNMSFKGNLDLDMNHLDDTILKFKSNLRGLKVISHNNTINFDSLRSEFTTHFKMPNGEVYMRQAGPKTERWTKLSEVSPLLPKAIMSQEDGGFYKHSGISLFHLRGSLIRNLKEGRFVRGGSTLSMQLTRNLFLNRKKNLSRKLEEICLTWLLERRLSKNEMMALYINIVEFGPNLFGIKEASEHYFQKHPSALRVEEITALTRMLPGPRLYAKFFERKKFSKAYTNRVNRLLALLVKKGHLQADAYQEITPTSLWDLPTLEVGDQEHSLEDMLEKELDAIDP
jgi:hypothetical protein